MIYGEENKKKNSSQADKFVCTISKSYKTHDSDISKSYLTKAAAKLLFYSNTTHTVPCRSPRTSHAYIIVRNGVVW